jgi:hypothetical protein
VFKSTFNLFLAFEFDLIYSDVLYNGFTSFIKNNNDEYFSLFTIDPLPEDYFFKHFKKYNSSRISNKNSYLDYIEFLERDPGNSPADALRFNTELMAFYSNSLNWGLIGSKGWEIAIIGFTDENTKGHFQTSFSDKMMFESVEKCISNIVLKLDSSEKTIKFYKELAENYK